ncbi:hypothetical protein [Blastococcus sp. TF02-8]|uniref:hypothetical protein n=1 Tax=Blastococcus sp. TF02-8 TaxID=2250574 RepID=UPI001412834B|nr:hypothetical protein [Blastococcus sp. TF02-8]
MVTKVRALEASRDAGTGEAAGRAPSVGEWLGHWLNNIAGAQGPRQDTGAPCGCICIRASATTGSTGCNRNTWKRTAMPALGRDAAIRMGNTLWE